MQQYPNLMKTSSKKPSQPLSRLNKPTTKPKSHMCTPKHVKIKLLNTSDKEKILQQQGVCVGGHVL